MKTWESGIYENDSARDYMNGVITSDKSRIFLWDYS